MYPVLGLSIFYFLFSFVLVIPSESHAQRQPVKQQPKKMAPEVVPHDLSFLSQAEDIEREAWWIITNKRLEGSSSPFRVFRTVGKVQKTKIDTKFCKNLLILSQGQMTWRVESVCQKPSIEIGLIQKLSDKPQKWKISWKNSPFTDHFGLSTSILYNQQSCEIEVGTGSRIEKMNCANYVRDRKEAEIVQMSTFEYDAKGKHILKIVGDVKKDLQVIATFNTEVPLNGDIVLKVKKIPQKPALDELANKTEFSNIKAPSQEAGESDGKKDQKENQSIQDNRNEENRAEKENGSEEEISRPIEVPAIAPPPTR